MHLRRWVDFTGTRVMTALKLRRACGALSSSLVILFALAVFAVPQRAAADDDQNSWANAVISEMKQAERRIADERVRVASLGNFAPSATPRRGPSGRSGIPREESPQASRSEKKTRVAALTNRSSDADRPSRSLSGGSVNWLKSASCLDSTLRGIVTALAAKFGPVTVNSTCRSKSHNRSVGGASKSFHLTGDAVDFRIHSNVSSAYAYLRGNGNVGGLKHYGGGLFHIDNGPRRSW
jgi:hypothetical protein